MSTPAFFYRIEVQGQLARSFSDHLFGMEIQPSDVAPEAVSVLTGWLQKPEMVSQVIEELTRRRYSILSVDRFDAEPE